jgi:hypothetical protein
MFITLNHQDGGECRGNAFLDTDNKIEDFTQSCDLHPGEKAHMETEDVAGPPSY